MEAVVVQIEHLTWKLAKQLDQRTYGPVLAILIPALRIMTSCDAAFTSRLRPSLRRLVQNTPVMFDSQRFNAGLLGGSSARSFCVWTRRQKAVTKHQVQLPGVKVKL